MLKTYFKEIKIARKENMLMKRYRDFYKVDRDLFRI
jgi:cytidylate kinase